MPEVPELADAGEPDAISRLRAASVDDARRLAKARLETDHAGAITAARTLLESVCKVILEDFGEGCTAREDLPKLYKLVQYRLQLAPALADDPDIRPALQGIASTVQGLGSLRNRAGDAHGRGRRAALIERRHAVLAVSSAETLANFLLETHEVMRPWRGYEIAHIPEIPRGFFGVWVPLEAAADASKLARLAAVATAVSTWMTLVREYGGKGPHQDAAGRTYFVFPESARTRHLRE